MNGFEYLPTQKEVGEYDARYVSDMRLAHWIYSHQSNQSTVMQWFDNWRAYNEDPAAFDAQKQMLRQMEQSDMDGLTNGKAPAGVTPNVNKNRNAPFGKKATKKQRE